jgi:hypothetical protein
VRRTGVLAATLLLNFLSACGEPDSVSTTTSQAAPKGPTSSGEVAAPTSSDALNGGVKIVASGRRQERPQDVPKGAGLPAAAVSTDPAVDWAASRWGPTVGATLRGGAPARTPGHSWVVAWDQRPTTGWGLAVTSARLEEESLILAGTQTAPGAGCAVAQVLTGTSYLLSVAVPDLLPGTPVRFELSETTRNCEG